MTDLPSELRMLVKRYGTRVLDDADGLRATLDDFLDEGGTAPGDVNLLIDAVRFGSLERLNALLDQGAEPSAATADVADALAQRRGGDADSAYWACAVLGYAAELLPADLVPGTWERPSSQFPPSATATSATSVPVAEQAAEVTNRFGQTGEAPVDDGNVTHQPSGGSAVFGQTSDGGDRHAPSTNNGRNFGAPIGGKETSRPGRSWLWAVVAAVIAVLLAGNVYFAVTRTTSAGNAAMSDRHYVKAAIALTPTPGATNPIYSGGFLHFGANDGAGLLNTLGKDCSDAAPPYAHYLEYRCPFTGDNSGFYLDFNNGDPVVTDAKNEQPTRIKNPSRDTIVTQELASSGSTSKHSYYMVFVGAGQDKLRNTDDDHVTLTLYDVAKDHAGAATFLSYNPNTKPLRRDRAQALFTSIQPNTVFPLPQALAGSDGVSSDLTTFAERFLTPEQRSTCVPAFTIFHGEKKHITCPDDPTNPTFTTDFGYTPNFAQPKKRFGVDNNRVSQGHSWSDNNGESGDLVISRDSVNTHLFWDGGSDYVWGLLSTKTQNRSFREVASDLIGYFEKFQDKPHVH